MAEWTDVWGLGTCGRQGGRGIETHFLDVLASVFQPNNRQTSDGILRHCRRQLWTFGSSGFPFSRGPFDISARRHAAQGCTCK